MTNRELMAEVLARPHDDAPRLAYAKWLKDDGDKDRAEFIKVQCDRAAKDRFDPAQERLEKKEKALLKKHEAEWLGELPEWARRGAKFRRGFVGVLRVELDAVAKGLAELVKVTPVDGIELSSGGAPAKSVKALAKCPEAAQLTELSLWFNEVGDAGAKAIAASPLFAGLKSLTLHAVGLADAGVKALAASPHLAKLGAINFGANEIGPDGLKAIFASAWRPKSLVLHNASLRGPEAAALARWEGLAGAEELGLGSCGIGPAGAKALAASPHLGSLKSLDIAGNPLGAAGVAALLAAPWAKTLVAIHIQASGLDDAAGLAIARAPELPDLRQLTLVNNNFSEATRQELVKRFGAVVSAH